MANNQPMIHVTFLVIVISLIYLLQASSATYMAAARVGSCYRKKAYGIIRMRKFECQKMGGRWNGRPGSKSWTDCHLDWCDIPGGRKRGKVARGKAWFVCPAWKQRSGTNRVYGIINMKRHECDTLNGKMNGNPAPQNWMNCHLYFCGVNGYSKNNIWGVIPASPGLCRNKQLHLAYGIIRMQRNDCVRIKGKYNGRQRSNVWLNCHLDWCISENCN